MDANLLATASELNRLDGTLAQARTKLGLGAADNVEFTTITGDQFIFAANSAGKFLSPSSYQFRNKGDTDFRDVQMKGLTATGAAFSGDVDVAGGLSADTVSFESTIGDKISLYDNKLDAIEMYGFGVEPYHLYFKSHQGYRWYSYTNADAGASSIMELSGFGDLDIAGTLTAAKVESTGNIIAYAN
jgi:hypothetical protein